MNGASWPRLEDGRGHELGVLARAGFPRTWRVARAPRLPTKPKHRSFNCAADQASCQRNAPARRLSAMAGRSIQRSNTIAANRVTPMNAANMTLTEAA